MSRSVVIYGPPLFGKHAKAQELPDNLGRPASI